MEIYRKREKYYNIANVKNINFTFCIGHICCSVLILNDTRKIFAKIYFNLTYFFRLINLLA